MLQECVPLLHPPLGSMVRARENCSSPVLLTCVFCARLWRCGCRFSPVGYFVVDNKQNREQDQGRNRGHDDNHQKERERKSERKTRKTEKSGEMNSVEGYAITNAHKNSADDYADCAHDDCSSDGSPIVVASPRFK